MTLIQTIIALSVSHTGAGAAGAWIWNNRVKPKIVALEAKAASFEAAAKAATAAIKKA
jgi:hypothetical protein